jgi:hypothetical protein
MLKSKNKNEKIKIIINEDTSLKQYKKIKEIWLKKKKLKRYKESSK